MRYAVCMCSFNRYEKTRHAVSQLLSASDSINIFLVDDGSEDGTRQLIENEFSSRVTIISTKNLYWSRSMHASMNMVPIDKYDAYILVNDDVDFNIDAVIDSMKIYESSFRSTETILVGAIIDSSGKTSYSGVARNSLTNPLNFSRVNPSGSLIEVETFNANFLIVDSAVVRKIGYIDDIFSHGLGDYDYGLRAKKAGIKNILLPRYVGECDRNPVAGTFLDKSISLRKRIDLLFGRKGIPISDFYVYSKRHGGNLWVINFLRTYIVMVAKVIGVKYGM